MFRLFDFVAVELMRAMAHHLCPASCESIRLHIASLGEDPNSKSEVLFLLNAYCFCVIVKSWTARIS